MMSDDMELVREFAASQSETAFAALVQRHLSLVHSAAMRQVGDEHLAQEIAQAVFIILAKKAPVLPPETVLSAWLYRTTRYAAANTLKATRRRQFREQEAYMQSILNQPDTDAWKQLAPLLDDAMAKLGEADRTALVLRFFENKTLGDVAMAMNTNEAAAQRRVLRAVEKLRSWFTKRGVALPVAAMTAAIAANSVQAAPAGLAVTICTAKGAAVAASVTALVNGTIKTIYMTTLQKTLIAASLVVAVGAGIYEAHEASTLQTKVQALQQQQTPLTDQNQQLTHERDDAAQQLAALRSDNERLKRDTTNLLKLRAEVAQLRADAQRVSSLQPTDTNDPTTAAAQAWVERVKLLKRQFDHWPGKKPPELQLLNEQDWLNEVANRELDSDVAIRETMSKLRLEAKRKFAVTVKEALELFVQSNNGQYPSAPSDLVAYLKPPVDSLLDGWEIAKPGSVHPPQPNSPDSKRAETWALVEKGTFNNGIPDFKGGGLSDPDYDMNVIIYRGGYYMYGPSKPSK